MVAPKLFFCALAILSVLVSVRAAGGDTYNVATYGQCQRDHLKGKRGVNDGICIPYLSQRECYQKAGFAEDRIVKAIEASRTPEMTKECASPSASFSVVIGIASLVVFGLQKIGVMRHY